MPRQSTSVIAVIASDQNCRTALCDLIANAGHTVVSLSDAGRAPGAIESSPPDLVVAGLSPADLEGWAACRAIRSSGRAQVNAIPILIVADNLRDEDTARLLEQIDALSAPASDIVRHQVEQQYAAAFEHCPAAASISNLEDGTFLQVNHRFEVLFGFAQHELIGHSAAEFGLIPLERRSSLRNQLEREGRLSGEEVQLRAKDGRVVHCLVNAELIRLGEQDRVLAMLLDITDRFRMEETIIKSEQRLRLALDSASTVVWEFYVADGSVHETGPVDRHFGRAKGFTHSNVAEIAAEIHPADRDRVLAAVESAMRGEGELRVEFRVPQPDGGEKWLAGNGTLIRDAEGKPQRLLGVGVDISDLKQVELSLHEREYELAAAQRIAKIGSWRWDVRTDRASWSDETFRIFGLEPGGLRQHRFSFLSMVHPDDRARVDQALSDALKGVAEYDLHYRIVCPDGQEKIIYAQGEVLRDHDGQPALMRGTVHDVTERKQAEAERERLQEQLRQAQKLESIGRLAGGIAHDFNNLLTVINGYADFLLEQVPDQDPLRSSLAEIRRAGERAADLTRQLLAFSRKQVIEPRPVNLNELILQAREMLGRIVREDIEIVTDLDPNPGEVMASPGQLHQVLMNLVVNARDAMPAGGRLSLHTSRLRLEPAAASLLPGAIPGLYAVLEITDTGIGMSEEVQQRVFDPFFTTKGPGEGTGLGLSTVYGIVRQAGGWIAVESRPEMGSTFRIGLPLVVEPSSQHQDGATAPRQLEGSETVLVVEDQDEVRQLALAVLKRFGYRTLEARSGRDALQVAANYAGPIDLMLTDMVMPGMTGKGLAERLRPARPEMRVLYMSGYTDDVITSRGILEPGIEFIEKPFSPGALALKIRRVLG